MNAIDKSEITDDQWEEVLDELYGTVEICGMTFNSGRALKELDRVAFDCGKNDYEDGNRKWECGECGDEYENEDDAEECCKPECVHCGEKVDNDQSLPTHENECSENPINQKGE